MVKIIENYTLHQQIGEGEYAKVYRAIDSKTKKEVAVKVIHMTKFKENPKLQQCTLNQIQVLSKIDCPYIVKFLQILKTANNFYFFYEYCNQGTLQQKIKKNGHLSQTVVLTYLTQILDAFKILSARNIMHRDLKPGNILLHDGKIKIADFGFCKSLETNKDLAQTMLGSPIYMAPQVLKGQVYTVKADIWSLGVVLYQALFGFCPFEENSIARLINLLDQSQLQFNKQINNISPGLEQLMRKMLTKDHFKRVNWEQIFQYKITPQGVYLKSYNSELRQNKGFYNTSDIKQSIDKGNSINITSFSLDKKSIPSQNLFKKKVNKQNPLELSDNEILKRNHQKLVNKVRNICQLLNYSYCPEITIPLANKFLGIIQKQVIKLSVNKKQIFTKQITQLQETLKLFNQSQISQQINQNIPLINQYLNYLQKNFPNIFFPNIENNRELLVLLLDLLEFNNFGECQSKQVRMSMPRDVLLNEINQKAQKNSL